MVTLVASVTFIMMLAALTTAGCRHRQRDRVLPKPATPSIPLAPYTYFVVFANCIPAAKWNSLAATIMRSCFEYSTNLS